MPGHNLPMTVLGTLILAFGWFGFNAGSTLSQADTRTARVAVNTMLAAAGGARLIVHGHHHESYAAVLSNGVRVRGLGIAERQQDIGEIVVGGGIVGLERERLLERRDRKRSELRPPRTPES